MRKRAAGTCGTRARLVFFPFSPFLRVKQHPTLMPAYGCFRAGDYMRWYRGAKNWGFAHQSVMCEIRKVFDGGDGLSAIQLAKLCSPRDVRKKLPGMPAFLF